MIPYSQLHFHTSTTLLFLELNLVVLSFAAYHRHPAVATSSTPSFLASLLGFALFSRPNILSQLKFYPKLPSIYLAMFFGGIHPPFLLPPSAPRLFLVDVVCALTTLFPIIPVEASLSRILTLFVPLPHFHSSACRSKGNSTN
jgi:hypothetical protein